MALLRLARVACGAALVAAMTALPLLSLASPTLFQQAANQEPLLLRHVNRILATQADDQATCDASFKNNPLASYLTALPETAGIRNCAASNIDILLAPLSQAGAKCTLTTLVGLFGTTAADSDMAAFSEFFSALVAGIAGASSDPAATPATPAASVSEILASWTMSSSTKNKAFCSAMNDQIGPCVDALLPALVAILDKKGACCSQLLELYELIKLIVPDGKTLDQTLVAIVSGLHNTMCSTTTDGAYCGQKVLTFLSSAVEKNGDTSLLMPLLFDAGLPLFALPEGDAQACEALDAIKFTSRVGGSGSFAYAALSCCAALLASLVESVDDIVKQLTGDSLADTLNLITGLQDAKAKFTSPYDTLSKCTFQTTCAKPSFTLTAKPGALPVLNPNDAAKKNAVTPQTIKCQPVDLCDQDKTCTKVCAEGTARVAPWVARAISYQRNLSYAQPLCLTQLPGTHNSATSLARGWGNRDQLMNKVLDGNNSNSFVKTANQFLSVTDQLNLGVRFLEIDVHYYGNKLRDGHCSRINFSFLDDVVAAITRTVQSLLGTTQAVEWQSSLMGCLPSLGGIRAENTVAHENTVQEIAKWVSQNPQNVIFVYLDIGSEVDDFQKMDQLISLYKTIFGDLIFTPNDFLKFGGSWEKFPLTQLIQQGKRVVVLGNGKLEIGFEKNKLCSGWEDIPSGKPGAKIWGQETNTGKLVRVYTSKLHYATMSEDAISGGSPLQGTASEPATLDASTMSVFTNAGVNILAADSLDGAVIQSMIWSWAPKEPTAGDTAVEISAKDGRWYGVVDKSSIKSMACVSSSDRLSWKIVAQGTACPSGFAFGAPTLGIENAALTAAVLAANGADGKAQVNVDLTNFPVITSEEAAAYEDGTGADGAGGGGNAMPTSGVEHKKSFSVLVAGGGLGALFLLLL